MLEKACDVAYPLVRSDRTSFGIADLATEFGITPRALRFYEDQGLIAPRRDNGHRIYSLRDRARLAWLLRGKSVGFSLSDIREILDLYDVDDDRRTQRAAAIARCRQRAEQLRAGLAETKMMIEQLSRFADSLEKNEL
jgi:DNA-binding transcriptional MerR regulator